jgi:hypothetical protein
LHGGIRTEMRGKSCILIRWIDSIACDKLRKALGNRVMAKTIELEDQTVAALAAQAKLRGLSVDQYLRRIAGVDALEPLHQGAEAVVVFDAALDELFAGDTRLLPPMPLSYSRDDIYFDHD